ncbi:MAG TPA: ABC transporter permease, partial [Candidatus Acidoferrales bacterium]|nr:ABC transporter permease [Candidatus Acidoferrales bacterium]
MAATIPANVSAFDDEDLNVTKVTFWMRLRRHKLAVAGIAVLVLMIVAAVFAKQLAPFNPDAIDNVHWQGTPLPPCFQDGSQCGGHPLGTDDVGRDLLSRLLYGARISLTVASFAVLMEVLIGTILGAISGYYGGWVDWLIMRVTDVFLSIPLLPL